MVKTVLYLVRHALTEANASAVFQGSHDHEISAAGHEQLGYLAQRFKGCHIDMIYSSPQHRAFETAVALNRHHSLPIILEDGLCEIHGGGFEGLPWQEVQQRYPQEAEIWYRAPHLFEAPEGETMRQVYERVRETIDRIVAANSGSVVVAVSHGCSLRNAMCYLTGTPFCELHKMDIWENTGVAKVECLGDGIFRVIYVGDASHLPDELCHYARNPFYSTDNSVATKQKGDS